MAEYFDRRLQTSLRDKAWVRKAFALSKSGLNDLSKARAGFTTAHSKVADTRLGGNVTINNPPQYTRFADPRVTGLRFETQASGALRRSRNGGDLVSSPVGRGIRGMGHYYSEQLDDQTTVLHLEMGMPRYTGMLSFFTGFYDVDAARAAREGRSGQGIAGGIANLIDSVAYMGGRILGAVVAIYALPIMVVGFLGKLLTGSLSSSSKYYTMTPAMHTYWTRATWIANSLAANKGLVPRAKSFYGVQLDTADADEVPPEVIKYAHQIAPDIFREEGGVDLYNIANRYARLQDLRVNRELDIAGTGNNIASDEFLNNIIDFVKNKKPVPTPAGETLDQFVTRTHKTVLGNLEYSADGATLDAVAAGLSQSSVADADRVDLVAPATAPPPEANPAAAAEGAPAAEPAGGAKIGENAIQEIPDRKEFYNRWIKDATSDLGFSIQQGYLSQLQDHFSANLSKGNGFIAFAVEHNGTVGESFSTQVGESQIQSSLNSFSSTAASARFNFSDGQTGIGVLDSVTTAVRSFIAGGLQSIQLAGLIGLAGSAFIDIPKHYQNSSASFPTMSYTMQLRAPYGHKLSTYMNIDIPMACLLAIALPMSTGKQSYTAPFLVQAFHRGRGRVRMGMITDLSFTRGAGNLGWNNKGQFLAVDVSFTITDLSSIFHAPINDGYKLFNRPYKGVFDDDNPFNDYMATLASLSKEDMYYAWRRAAINLAKYHLDKNAYFSSSRISSMVGSIGGIQQAARVLNIGGATIQARSNEVANLFN